MFNTITPDARKVSTPYTLALTGGTTVQITGPLKLKLEKAGLILKLNTRLHPVRGKSDAVVSVITQAQRVCAESDFGRMNEHPYRFDVA